MIDRQLAETDISTVSEKSSTLSFAMGITGYSAGLVACWLLLGFGSIKPFSLLSLGGDSLATLNDAKNYINGNGFRINPSLAFPGVQDNAFFPSFDFSYRAFMRVAAQFTHDPAAIYYLLYVVGVGAMFAATAFALRSLRFDHWLSIIGAVVYTVSPWLVFRSFVHDFLALYYSAPLGAALALRVGLNPPTNLWRLRGRTGIAVSLLVIATSGLYYAYFSLMFLAFVGIVVASSNMDWRPLLTIAISTFIVVALLLVTGFGSGLVDVLTGNIPTVKRAAGAQLVFGLNFAEATHLFDSIPSLRWVHKEYIDFWPYLNSPQGLLDWPGIALTLVIFASPLILTVAGFSAGPRSYWASLIFLASACVVFGVIYSMDGGLAYYFNLFVTPYIRATDRIIPFLSFFALVMMLSAIEVWLAKRAVAMTSAAVVTITVLLVSMVPTVNGLASRETTIMEAPVLTKNIASIKNVLATKDREGITAILQFPHVPWPETGPMRGFDLYSLQDYFILDSAGSNTKWSYGGYETQPSYLAVKNAVDQNKSHNLVAAASKLGFDGALIEKPPFEENGWQILAANIGENACKVFEDDLRILYVFRACR
jgi:hypothetical protein